MTLAQAISQDVPAHPEWQYTHKAFVPSLLCKTLMIGRKAATLGGQSADAVAQQLLAEDERAAAQPVAVSAGKQGKLVQPVVHASYIISAETLHLQFLLLTAHNEPEVIAVTMLVDYTATLHADSRP